MKEHKQSSPFLADIIVKVKSKQRLSEEEALAYLMHIKKIPEPEAKRLVQKNFDKRKRNDRN